MGPEFLGKRREEDYPVIKGNRAPNIVLIMADQLAPQFTGAYGHPVVKTPHIDALAGRGMRFDSAYCNSPLCAPSRFSFMSGQLISRIGAYDNASEFSASVPTFAHYLKIMGYRTCFSGKMHFFATENGTKSDSVNHMPNVFLPTPTHPPNWGRGGGRGRTGAPRRCARRSRRSCSYPRSPPAATAPLRGARRS